MAGNPAQIGLFSRAATRFRSDDHHHGHLNFKSANAYFCTEPLIGGGACATALNFKFSRAQPVSSVAPTNFPMFLPAYALSFVSPPLSLCFSIYPPPDLRYPADFIYGGTDYVSELIP